MEQVQLNWITNFIWGIADDVLRLLDYPAYFDLLQQPLPASRGHILAALAEDNLIRSGKAGGWDITNLGGVLFAKRLNDFRILKRKAVRVIQYRGTGRIETLKEQVGTKGYASGFEDLVGYILNTSLFDGCLMVGVPAPHSSGARGRCLMVA